MSFVYESEWARVWSGPAETLYPVLKRKTIGLVVTDPPYGQKWSSGLRNSMEGFEPMLNDDGTYDPLPVIEAACRRVLRINRHVYVFGPYKWAKGAPFGKQVELVWDKELMGPGDLTLPWGPQWEPIQFSMYVPSKRNREDGYGNLSARLRQGAVIRAQRGNSRQAKRHPTEKPVTLLRQLIESSSLVGDTVLDLYGGSGSTAVASILCQRKIVIAEIDKNYVDVIVGRIKATEKVIEGFEGL